MPPLPPVTQALLLINVAIFCIDLFLGPWFTRLFALWPLGTGFLPWQLVTYAFLHGSVPHLFFNMLGLWMFGAELEQSVGRAPLRAVLLRQRAGAARGAAAGGRADRLVRPDRRRVGRPVRPAARLRHDCSRTGTIVPLIPPIPMKAKHLRDRSTARIELFFGVTGTRRRRRALRAPGRHARRLADDPLLARPAAVRAAARRDRALPPVFAPTAGTAGRNGSCSVPSARGRRHGRRRTLVRQGRRTAARRTTAGGVGCAGRWRRPSAPPTSPRPPARSTREARPDAAAAVDRAALRRRAAALARAHRRGGRRAQRRGGRTPAPSRRSAACALGSGVVIDDDGLVLTIGYLMLEAEQVDLLVRTDGAPCRPAWSRTTWPPASACCGRCCRCALRAGAARPRGRRRRGRRADGRASGGDATARQPGAAGLAAGVLGLLGVPHRRGALHRAGRAPTTAARRCSTRDGELLGIGSLVVADVRGAGGRALPGNMFVPVDLLSRSSAELRDTGASRASRRAWLGINCVGARGRAAAWCASSADSPAEAAGLRPGDRIVPHRRRGGRARWSRSTACSGAAGRPSATSPWKCAAARPSSP